MGGTLGETRLRVESDNAIRVMELETQNELLIKSTHFWLKINPGEIAHDYYPSFLADIEFKITTFNQTQFQYSGDIWFSLMI
jgi:phenylalanine-4-hydroxylase